MQCTIHDVVTVSRTETKGLAVCYKAARESESISKGLVTTSKIAAEVNYKLTDILDMTNDLN